MRTGPRRALIAAGLVAASLAALPRLVPGPEARVSLRGHGGGWSGIDVDAGGRRALLLNDRGRYLAATLLREGDRLAGLAGTRDAATLGMGDEVADSEGLDAFGPATGGEIVVSFEGFARLRRFPLEDPGAPWGWIRDLPPDVAPRRNRGLEAVARDATGRAYTLAERPSAGTGAFDLMRLAPDPHWHVAEWEVAARLAADPGWWAVGADFGPDGGFHLLERRFLGAGFSSRIRRFQPGGFGAGLRRGEVVWSPPPFRFGNLEGLALWRDADGATRAIMVSDDNGWPVMRGELIEILLPAAPLAEPAPAQ
mgnify:CR=1 FL=1